VSPSQASASPTHLLHKGRVALEVTAVVEDDLQPARTRPSTRLSQCASSSSRRTSHRALRVVLSCGLQRQHGAHGLCMTRTHARHSPSSSPQIGPQFSGVLQRTPSPRPALLGPPCSARPARPALLGPPCSARPAQGGQPSRPCPVVERAPDAAIIRRTATCLQRALSPDASSAWTAGPRSASRACALHISDGPPCPAAGARALAGVLRVAGARGL
jgi:hypothetical protein